MAELEKKTVFDYEQAKFRLGEYKLPIEDSVAEIVEACKKEFPEINMSLLWVATVDYVMKEELKIDKKKDDNEGKELYEGYLKERKYFNMMQLKYVILMVKYYL